MAAAVVVRLTLICRGSKDKMLPLRRLKETAPPSPLNVSCRWLITSSSLRRTIGFPNWSFKSTVTVKLSPATTV